MAMEHEYQLANRVEMLEDISFVMSNQIEVLRHALRECAEHIETSPNLNLRGTMIAYAARKILSGEYGL